MVSCTGCGEWYHECMPIPKQVWRRNSKYECIVTTAEYNIVYNIVYIFLVHISVHLDMLNKIIVHLYSESMIVYIHGDTIFTSECSQTWCQSG